LQGIEKSLPNVKKYAIDYLKRFIEKYVKDFPRKTRIKAIEEIDKRAIETKEIKIGFDLQADKKTILTVVYRVKESGFAFAKRFIVNQFILDKLYRYIPENAELQYISTQPKATIELHFAPSTKLKEKKRLVSLH
jgi:topoisomerase-4 subunit A